MIYYGSLYCVYSVNKFRPYLVACHTCCKAAQLELLPVFAITVVYIPLREKEKGISIEIIRLLLCKRAGDFRQTELRCTRGIDRLVILCSGAVHLLNYLISSGISDHESVF